MRQLTFFALSMFVLGGCGKTTLSDEADMKIKAALAAQSSELQRSPQPLQTKKIKVDRPNQLVPIYRVKLQVCGYLINMNKGEQGCISNHRGEVLWGEVSEPILIAQGMGLYDVALRSGGCVPLFKTPQPPVYRLAEMPFTLQRQDSPKPIVKMTRTQLTEQTLADYIEDYNKSADTGMAMMIEDRCPSVPQEQIPSSKR